MLTFSFLLCLQLNIILILQDHEIQIIYQFSFYLSKEIFLSVLLTEICLLIAMIQEETLTENSLFQDI